MRRVFEWWPLRSLAGSAPIGGGLCLVALWGWVAGGDQGKLTHFFINVMLVVALQAFSGNSGILSFGHMALFGVGAYVAGILTLDPALKATYLTGLPHFLLDANPRWWIALALASLAGAVIALGTGIPILRLDGTGAVIALLALLLIADVVFGSWTGVTRGGAGLIGLPPDVTMGRALGFAIAAVFLCRLFKDSKTGLLLRASREDPFSAASVGVDVRQYRLRAWVLSGFVAGAAGALFAWWIGTISPTNFFLAPTFALIVMFIVGGKRTVAGAVVGAALVTLVQEGVRPHEDSSVRLGFLTIHRLTGLTQIALVLMILAVMYVRREGIIGREEPDEWLARLLGRSARTAPGIESA
jgi:branched-chain amino acid transport system permease protein